MGIREVFKCSVLISFWRVRRAWHKNLMEKCSEADMRVEMSRRLGEAVSIISRGNGDMNLFQAFMEDFVDCSGFLDYFMAIWFPKIGAWTTALKALPLASTEVSAAIESYHHQLSLRLLNEKDSLIYKRVDWLVDKLGTKVHSYYWLDEYSEKDSFARYWKDEWKSDLTSWRQALHIPDSDVVLDDNCAKVVSHKNRDKVHTVLNPGSEFALCDCGWSKIGNLCKHVIKSTRFCRDRRLATPSTSLFDYNCVLKNILNCPPHDSVLRDHALAIAVSVQTQLSTLFAPENNSANTATFPREQQATVDPYISATENVETANKSLLSEDQLVSENSDGNLGDENQSSTQEYATCENVTGNHGNAILKHPEAPSTGLPPIEQHCSGNNVITSNGTENEQENVLNQSLSLGSTTCNTSRIGDGSLDDMMVDSCSDDVTVRVASVDQVCDGVLENSVTEKMIDIDPHSFHSFASISMSEVVNSAAEEDFTLQISDALINKEDESDNLEAHPYESMIVDTVEVSNSISHKAEKQPVTATSCHINIVGNLSLDKDIVVIESGGVGGVKENIGNGGQTICTDTIDYDCFCGDGDRMIKVAMPNRGTCKHEDKEIVHRAKMNASESGLRSSSGVAKVHVLGFCDAKERVCADQVMDGVLAEEKGPS